MSDGSPSLPTTDGSGHDLGPGGQGGLHDTRYMLRLTTDRWRSIPPGPPLKAAATVIGASLVLAWARLGFQGIDAPRALVRLVLVGVYGWLGLTAIVLIGLRLAGRRPDSGPVGATEPTPVDPVRLLQVIGLGHQPLVVLAIALVIGQAITIPFVLPILTAFTFAVWFPGQLLTAVHSMVAQRAVTPRSTTPIVAIAYIGWVLTVGRHLLDQLGHLI